MVSLTSFPARFHCLPKTLKSLLDQTIKPDRTILWIAHADITHLTKSILELKSYGLEICECEDIRSYKKIVPALEAWPDSFLVIADDDIYYESHWLSTIVAGFDRQDPTIVCRRAHRPTRDESGRLKKYTEWESEIQMEPTAPPEKDIFPTGIGGVLYYPGCFYPDVTNREKIRELCPDADDIWLYWMGRMAHVRYRQVGGTFEQISWIGSQATSLRTINVGLGRNDIQIKALEDRYGLV